ncbi:MAG: DUF7507 domain-containing protein, partial [Anaerolineales bacterium]
MSGRSKKYMFFGKVANMLGVALAIASLVTNLLPVGIVSAHHATITATVVCQSDGTKLVTWKIENSEGSSHPMDITSINPAITGVGVGTLVATSVQGTQTFAANNHSTVSLSIGGHWAFDNYAGNFSGSKALGSNTCPTPASASVSKGSCNWTERDGSLTDVTLTLDHASLTIGGNTYTSSQTIHLSPGSYSYNWTAQSGYTGSGSGSISIGDCNPPDYQLNLSHIQCVNNQVEIHFVLLNVPDGVTPGTLTYTYGSISPTNHTGNVWHYFDYKPDGYYNVTSASVVVSGTTVNLHNPGAYADTYNCGTTPPAANASVTPGTCSWTQDAGSLTDVAITVDHASLTIGGHTYTASQIIHLSPGEYPYNWTAQTGYTGSGNGSVSIGDCTPGTATASATISGSCSWTQGGGSVTPVTIALSHASLTINSVTYTTPQTINLGPGSYHYTWAANEAGYIGNGSGDLTIGDCTPGNADASATIGGSCSWTQAGGSVTPVTIALNHASLTINSVTYTTPQTINLGPGSYHYTWAANEAGYIGSGSGDVSIGDCTPPDAHASVVPGSCGWTMGAGSQTPVTYTLTGASLTITKDGTSDSYGPVTTSGSINLGPGSYSYTWVATTGYKGGDSGTFKVIDCTPPDGNAKVDVGSCSWNASDGSLTEVALTITGASLTIDGVGTYTSSQTIKLPKGDYTYSWTATLGYKGGDTGKFSVGDCTPPDATASVTPGACSWSRETGPLIPVSINVSDASLLLNGVTYTSSTTVNLAPGTYPYSWTALVGFKGSGSGSLVIGDCTPGKALASVSTGTCSFSKETGAKTPLTITLTGASFTINGETYNVSTNIDLGPGLYPYSWTALTGYDGSGSGNLNIGNCNPADPLVKTAHPITYSSVGTLISYTYELTNIGNVVLTGVKVTDDKASVSCPKDTLAVNESMTCTATYSIVQYDLDAGFVTNIATAVTDQTPANHDSATVTAVITTGLTLDKTVAESTYTLVGDLLHYSYVVKNTGNVTLTSVGVTDDKTTAACPKPTLAPQESMTCIATYAVTNADMRSEQITNTAFASGLYKTLPVQSTPDSATVIRFFKLTLTSLCAANSAVNDGWKVTNDNNYAVGFEYSLDGGVAGTGSVGS